MHSNGHIVFGTEPALRSLPPDTIVVQEAFASGPFEEIGCLGPEIEMIGSVVGQAKNCVPAGECTEPMGGQCANGAAYMLEIPYSPTLPPEPAPTLTPTPTP